MSTSTVHVAPVGDVVDHEDTDECACLPHALSAAAGGGGVAWVVVHNAWDGRQ